MAPSVRVVCDFCSKSHNSVSCQKYSTTVSRRDFLRRWNLCFRCLQAHYAVEGCESGGCTTCNQRNHHTAVCSSNDSTGSDSDDQTVDNKPNLNNGDLSVPVDVSWTDEEVPKCMFCGLIGHHPSKCSSKVFDPKKEADTYQPCVFCSTHFMHLRCPKVPDCQGRIQSLQKQGRCLKCLRHHLTEACQFRTECMICHSSHHHHVICPEDPYFEPPTVTPSSPSTGYCSNDSLNVSEQSFSLNDTAPPTQPDAETSTNHEGNDETDFLSTLLKGVFPDDDLQDLLSTDMKSTFTDKEAFPQHCAFTGFFKTPIEFTSPISAYKPDFTPPITPEEMARLLKPRPGSIVEDFVRLACEGADIQFAQLTQGYSEPKRFDFNGNLLPPW